MMSNIILRRLCLSSPRMAAIRLSTTSSTTTQTEDYFTKNEKLKRPLSPFIVYKLQLTSTLSFTHRMTGLGLSVLLYGGGIAALFSSQTNFAQVVQYISGNVSPTLLLAFKVLTGTTIAYHTFNGIRHIMWDFGYGFKIKELYTSGYVVVVLTILSAIALVLANN